MNYGSVDSGIASVISMSSLEQVQFDDYANFSEQKDFRSQIYDIMGFLAFTFF